MSLIFLFDYDGVLTHKKDFVQSIADRYQLNVEAIRRSFAQYLQACLRGKGDLIQLLEGQLNNIGWAGSAQGLYDAIYKKDKQHNENMLQLIREDILDIFPAHLATNQDFHRCRVLAIESVIQELFVKIYCSADIGYAKPEQQYFEHIYADLLEEQPDLQKRQLVFIDDQKDNVDQAARIGLTAHHFQDLERFKQFLENLWEDLPFPILSHERFSLSRMQMSHAEGYSDILSEKSTYHYLTASGPVNPQQAIQKIRKNQRACRKGSSLYWSILGNDGSFLGYIAAHNLQQSEVALSYGIHPAFRRQGYGSAALKVLLFWKGLTNKRIQLATHLDNHASFRLLSNMALSYQGVQKTSIGDRHVFIRQAIHP
ncbi:MAG: GNAT family N-acetyltransferase [Bacteroidota bacterium]